MFNVFKSLNSSSYSKRTSSGGFISRIILFSISRSIDDYNNKNKKEEKLLENNEEDKVKIEENDENENILPKLRFYQYLFNNIYKKNCCNSNNQEIISTCNEIISKYFSIENIIYNQLLLDNLFTDYIWNEPKLKNIENNKLVNDLNLLLLNK